MTVDIGREMRSSGGYTPGTPLPSKIDRPWAVAYESDISFERANGIQCNDTISRETNGK